MPEVRIDVCNRRRGGRLVRMATTTKYAATEMGRLDAELCKKPCDGHFRGWEWLYAKIKDSPEKLELAEKMLRTAIFDHKQGTRLNLTYWYKVWYGLDFTRSLAGQTRDKNCYSVLLGLRS